MVDDFPELLLQSTTLVNHKITRKYPQRSDAKIMTKTAKSAASRASLGRNTAWHGKQPRNVMMLRGLLTTRTPLLSRACRRATHRSIAACANQVNNPNNPAYWKSRGLASRPDNCITGRAKLHSERQTGVWRQGHTCACALRLRARGARRAGEPKGRLNVRLFRST